MAVSSTLFCVFSSLWPHAAPSTAESSDRASPRAPIRPDGLDSAAAEVERVLVSPPASPSFVVGAVAEGEETLFPENGAAFSLIERMDDEWFKGNVVGSRWWRAREDSDWYRPPADASTEVIRGIRNDSGSELTAGIRSPDSNSNKASVRAASLFALKSIEMVQPLVRSSSFSKDKEARGQSELPMPRLRRLQRRGPPDGDMYLSDGEQKRYPNSRLSKKEDIDARRRLGAARIEPSKAKARPRRRKEKKTTEASVPPRRFSDGEEPEGVSSPLTRVREVRELQTQTKPSRKPSVTKSSSLKKQDYSDLERPMVGRLETVVAGRAMGSASVENHSEAGPPPPRRRRKGARKNSKSLTELEYNELRGCLDLGFNCTREELTPRVVSALPSSFYRAGDDLLNSPRWSSPKWSSPKWSSSPRAKSNPQNQGWGKPDSPLPVFRLPSPMDNTVDMKAQLKFWAHSVASTVSAEC